MTDPIDRQVALLAHVGDAFRRGAQRLEGLRELRFEDGRILRLFHGHQTGGQCHGFVGVQSVENAG